MLLWIGIMMVVDEAAGVASIGAGVILLAAAALRKAVSRRAAPAMLIAGLLLLALGVNDLNGDDKGIPLLAVALIAFGTLMLVKALTRPSRGSTITIVREPRPPRD